MNCEFEMDIVCSVGGSEESEVKMMLYAWKERIDGNAAEQFGNTNGGPWLNVCRIKVAVDEVNRLHSSEAKVALVQVAFGMIVTRAGAGPVCSTCLRSRSPSMLRRVSNESEEEVEEVND